MRKFLATRAGAALAVMLLSCAGGLVATSCSSSPIKQTLQIGSPCHLATDCGTDPFLCELTTSLGYCTKTCKGDLDCPPESICLLDGSGSGTCRAKCPPASCSMGYECKPASNDKNAQASRAYCGPTMMAQPDAATPGDGATPMDGPGGGQGG